MLGFLCCRLSDIDALSGQDFKVLPTQEPCFLRQLVEISVAKFRMPENKLFLPLNCVFEGNLKPEQVRTWVREDFSDESQEPAGVQSPCKKKAKSCKKSSKRLSKSAFGDCTIANIQADPVKKPDYLNYVRAQKTPSEQRHLTEQLLSNREASLQRKVLSLDPPRRSFQHPASLAVESPVFSGLVLPRPASRSPSEVLPFVLSETLVKMKAPKTGLFVNEHPVPPPRRTFGLSYDPRGLQQMVDLSGDKFLVTDKKGQLYAIPMSKKKKSKAPALKMESPKPVSEKRLSGKPEVRAKTRQKRVTDLRLQLGWPVGLELGTLSIFDEQFSPTTKGKQGLACALTALGFAYIKPPGKWTPHVLDRIIQLGTNLHETDVIQSTSAAFEIDDVSFEVSIQFPPVVGTLSFAHETDPDIYQSLLKTLKKQTFVVFQCRHLTLLLWRRTAYHIFDPVGRTASCSVGSQAALMTLNDLTNVVHVIVNLSNLPNMATFSLSRVEVKRIQKQNEPAPKKLSKKSKKPEVPGYEVLNVHRAALRSDFHLRHPIFKDARNRFSLPVSVAALSCTKIDPPATWNRDILDKIVSIGNELFRSWSRDGSFLFLEDLPSSFQVGQFSVALKLQPFVDSVPINKAGEENVVFELLQDTLSEGTRALLQVNRMFFAAWRKNRIYYLFDPYPRDRNGDVTFDHQGMCCVQMFSFLPELSHIFRRNMIQVQPHELLHIHLVEFVEITPNPHGIPGKSKLLVSNSADPLFDDDVPKNLPSLEDSLKYQTPKKLKTPQAEQILILDSPSASITAFNNCKRSELDFGGQFGFEPKKLVSDSKLSQLDSAASEDSVEEPQDVSPLVRYLGTAVAHDVVNQALKAISCRKAQNQTRFKEDGCDEDNEIIADRILLQSDLKTLEYERWRLQKQPGMIPHENCPCRPPEISLSKEMVVPSNFQELPDGAQIVFGGQSLDDLEVTLHHEYLLAVSAVSAMIASFKYSIATWDSKAVDWVLQLTKDLADSIDPQVATTLFSVPNHGLPLVKLGRKSYDIRIEMVRTCKTEDLPELLEKLFSKTVRVLVLSPACSVAVFKRKNFYYMFEGLPCNLVGFREAQGRACFMRFTSISALLDRLRANHSEISAKSMVALSQMILKQSPEDDLYPQPTPSLHEMLLNNARCEAELRSHEKQRQLDEIDAVIEQERERVAAFRGAGRSVSAGPDSKHSRQSNSSSKSRPSSNQSSRPRPSSNRTSGVRPSSTPSGLKAKKYQYRDLPEPVLHPLNPKTPCGYLMRDSDLLHKIQGTTSFSDRGVFEVGVVRSCHFSCVFATLLALHCPVKSWNYRKVDQCLENGRHMMEKVEDPSLIFKREIKDVQVENVLYDVLVLGLDSNFRPRVRPLRAVLEGFFVTSLFVIIQFINCSFLLHRDEQRLFHVFDSYDTMELCKPLDELELEELERRRASQSAHPEQNTASWVTFASMEGVIEYLERRTRDLKDYLLYRVKVVASRKAPKQSMLGYLLYKSEPHETQWLCSPNVEQKLEPEEIGFVEGVSRPPWSRLCTKNLARQPRGCPQSVWNHYDVEIPQELYSLWGNLHPLSTIFQQPGKQYLAIYVVACGMAQLYHLDFWTSQLLDSIVVHGNAFFKELCSEMTDDYEVELADLSSTFRVKDIQFRTSVDPVLQGTLYTSDPQEFNLSRALTYFFRDHKFGILLVTEKALLIGKEKAFFMLDCQSHGAPLFPHNQGAPYLLRCCSLRRLMEAVLVTLNITKYCQGFALYGVEVQLGDEMPESVGEEDVQEEIELEVHEEEVHEEEVEEALEGEEEEALLESIEETAEEEAPPSPPA